MRVKCRGTGIKPDINLACITCHFHVPVRILIIIIFVIPIQGEKEFIPCLQSEHNKSDVRRRASATSIRDVGYFFPKLK